MIIKYQDTKGGNFLKELSLVVAQTAKYLRAGLGA
jgi:hypothetical protein